MRIEVGLSRIVFTFVEIYFDIAYRKSGVKGRVEVNGSARKFKSFKKHSAYITQDDHFLPYLTVDEYMVAAAHLKLGKNVSDKEKKSKVGASTYFLT